MKMTVLADYKKHMNVDSSFEENLLNLLRLEDEQRDKMLVRRRIKQAGFPVIKTLDTFEFNQAMLPHLKKEQVLELSLCEFIQNRTNVVAIGNSGTGKTHIATALGMEAIRRGYSVRFRRACDLATQLAEAQSEKHLSRMLKILHQCQLLVVDELGYMTLDQRNSNLLFQVLAGRYEVRSTIVTSNLEFSKWPEFIGDRIMATALVDRLVHRSAILNMNGEGYRLHGPKQ
jgi:DNA replication protein DnaC